MNPRSDRTNSYVNVPPKRTKDMKSYMNSMTKLRSNTESMNSYVNIHPMSTTGIKSYAANEERLYSNTESTNSCINTCPYMTSTKSTKSYAASVRRYIRAWKVRIRSSDQLRDVSYRPRLPHKHAKRH